MSSRYTLRSQKNQPPKRKRPHTTDPIDDDDTEQTQQLQTFLKTIIENIMQDELEGTLNKVDSKVTQAFNENLKKTSDQFAKLTIENIKSVILDSCHEMIHSHLDNFDLSLSTISNTIDH